jgi:hypothetical protein
VIAGEDVASSSSDGFLDARDADRAALTPYERQKGEAGHEETYAESAAGYYEGTPEWRNDHPHLALYWETDPLAGGTEP